MHLCNTILQQMENQKASQLKTVTNSYCIRMPSEFRARAESVRLRKSLVAGKNIPLSKILIEACSYGLEHVELDLLQQSAMPFDVSTRTKKIVALARSITQAADESGLFSDGEAA